MSRTYYNTTHTFGRQLAKFSQRALGQEQRILAFYETADAFLYTPSEVRQRVFDDSVPLTSVRRAMTNLTTRAKLFKSTKQRPGPYGKPEHCWYRRVGKPTQFQLFRE